MTDIINSCAMIDKIFENIKVGDIQESNNLFSTWKKVVAGIKNSRDPYYGQKIVEHSDVVDLKNGQLLVEADHPGWIQVMQLHSKFIIRGLNMNLPELKIDALAFRLKGSDAKLYDIYDSEFEKMNLRFSEKDKNDEKEIEKFYEKNKTENNINSYNSKQEENLPPEFLATLASIGKSIAENEKSN